MERVVLVAAEVLLVAPVAVWIGQLAVVIVLLFGERWVRCGDVGDDDFDP